MKPILYFLSLGVGAALLSVSAHAACGGGGYKSAKVVESTPQAVPVASYRSEGSSRLESYQRDVDKAQAKLDRCTGDCTKERRKLEEAQAKYARKAGEV